MSTEREAQFYRVTERPFTEILNLSNLTISDIEELALGSVIIDIGSGINQEFANGVKAIREDLLAVSIDPSLGIPISTANIRTYSSKNTDRRTIEYNQSEINKQKGSEFIQKQRKKQAMETGNVIAALAPNLPFKASSAELIIDTYGPGVYFQEKDLFQDHIKEILRVLSPEGRASIYPPKADYDLDTLQELFPEAQIQEYKRLETEYNDRGQSRQITKKGIVIRKSIGN